MPTNAAVQRRRADLCTLALYPSPSAATGCSASRASVRRPCACFVVSGRRRSHGWPLAIHTSAVGFEMSRPSCATTRKLYRIGPVEKSASPGVSTIVFCCCPWARASIVPRATTGRLGEEPHPAVKRTPAHARTRARTFPSLSPGLRRLSRQSPSKYPIGTEPSARKIA